MLRLQRVALVLGCETRCETEATVEGVAYASFCFALAALLSVQTWALKTGRLKKWPKRNYYASGSTSFAAIPAYALAAALMGLAFLAALLPGTWVLVAPLLVAGAFACFVLGLIWAKWPREWIKPEWLKEAERRKREGLPPDVPRDVVGGRIVVSAW